VWVDDTGWYLVADANRADLGFKTGWVAAGTEADPFLAAATFSSVSATRTWAALLAKPMVTSAR
jgi:hypothetical protein